MSIARLTGLLTKHATAVAAALFTAVAASGLAMFFHVGESLVKEMHEWLAVVFVLAATLHVYRNWTAFKTYFTRRTIFVPLALTAIAATAFIAPAAFSERSDPVATLFQAMERASLEDVARFLDVPGERIEAALKREGFTVASRDQRVSAIAALSQKPTMAAVMTILDTPTQ